MKISIAGLFSIYKQLNILYPNNSKFVGEEAERIISSLRGSKLKYDNLGDPSLRVPVFEVPEARELTDKVSVLELSEIQLLPGIDISN